MDLSEISFERMKKPVISGFSSMNSLENFGQEKITSLKNSIEEIKNLVEERKKLSDAFIKEGDAIKLEIDNQLLDNEHSSKNLMDKDFMIEKNALRNKKVEISELQLNEKINCWKDIALLKKELRQYEKELTEKETRINELNEILNEGN